MSYVSPYLQMKPRSLAVARREVTEHRQVKGRNVVVTTRRATRYVNCESCGTLYNVNRNRVCPICMTFNRGN